MSRFLFLMLCCLSFITCSKEDIPSIDEFIKTKGLKTNVTEEGLHYIIEKPGNLSKKPNVYSDVVVKYKGTLLNDKKFDEQETAKFNLSQLVAGWRIGVPLIGEGGEIKLIIPPYLGYGNQARGDIPKNADLYFEITLKEVIN